MPPPSLIHIPPLPLISFIVYPPPVRHPIRIRQRRTGGVDYDAALDVGLPATPQAGEPDVAGDLADRVGQRSVGRVCRPVRLHPHLFKQRGERNKGKRGGNKGGGGVVKGAVLSQTKTSHYANARNGTLIKSIGLTCQSDALKRNTERFSRGGKKKRATRIGGTVRKCLANCVWLQISSAIDNRHKIKK